MFQEIAGEAQLDNLDIRSDTFFELFPFHIVFNKHLTIRSIGAGLKAVMPHFEGQAIDEMFILTRPLIEFTLENVSLGSTGSVFMLQFQVVPQSSFTVESPGVPFH